MESACLKRFLAASPNETEWYLYAKRIKIESDQKSREKEQQQKLEESINCGNRYQTLPHAPLYLSERQNNWALEKQSCDTAREICVREFFRSQTCVSERLPCRISENELPTKNWSPENEEQDTIEYEVSLKSHAQPLETKLLSVPSAADTSQNPQLLNPPQVQQHNRIEQSSERNEASELKPNSSVTSLNRPLLQMELLSRKSDSNKKWKQYQLLQIPFLSGTSSYTEKEKNTFLKNACSREDKNYSSSDKEYTAGRDNKGKNNPLYIIPTLKPFKSIQPLEIPNFQLPSILNKTNREVLSTNLKETAWKKFEGQPSLMQSNQIPGVQKVSEVGKQKLQNDKSSVRASTPVYECKEKYYPPTSKQEHSALAEGGKVSGAYLRGNSTNIECNQILAENDFRDKMLENSEGDDDQKSKIHICISAKNVQNEKCVRHNDLLQRMGRNNSNEDAATFHVQMSIPVITEALEKNNLDLHCGVHNSNSDLSLYEAESKPSAKEILDIQSYASKITFESICPGIIEQNFPYKRVSCNIFRGKEMLKLKFSFQNILFGWVRTWTESIHKDMPTCEDDSVAPWFHCHDTLKELCDAQELVKSTRNRKHNDNKICICLLAVLSKHLNVKLLKTILASFVTSTSTLLTTEGKSGPVEKQPLCDRKQNQLNSCTDETLRQNTEFLKENETSKFVQSFDFISHIGCQRRCISGSLGEEKNTFLQREALIHSQKIGLYKERHVRKHHLLSRVSGGFSTSFRSIRHKNSVKRQILVAKSLVLLQGTSDYSSLYKRCCCNITKIHILIGANLRFQNYFPAHSQLKFEKMNSQSTNQKISVTTVKQEKKKPSKMFNSSFHRESFKAFPFVLCENQKHKTTGYRNCIMSTTKVTDEVTHMKKYLGTCSYINADRKECVNSKELQINSHRFLSKKYFSIFDTYEKVPLTTDSEDFDQILVVNQDSSVKNTYEESAVTSSKEVQCLPVKSNDVLILPEQSKIDMEKYNSLLLRDRQTNRHGHCEELDTYSPHLANKNVEGQNSYLNSENTFPSSSCVYQSVTLPLDSSSLVNRAVSEDGHCRNSSSADKQAECETIHANRQYPSTGSPTMADRYLQLQTKETAQFSLHGCEQTNMTVSLEPATLKQHLEYVKEQEERKDEQMCVTNESQCETVMNDLIISYSEDESKTLIAAEEELKMHFSIMNNGCLEDLKDKYLPSENKITHEFELKRKFDLVLEELHMFHEISKGNENNLSSLETNSDSEGIEKNVTSASQEKICISSPICGAMEGQNITDSNESASSLNEKILNENEDQEVSEECFTSRLSSEELRHSPDAEDYLDAAYRKPYTWIPAFLPCTFFKEQSCNLQKEGGYFVSWGIRRLQPLKTCKGPIKIGLSRKARPKQLHPYLK